MDAVSPATRITLPLAPAGAGLLALLTGMAVLAAPTTLLEAFALDSGIAAIVAAAEPPLGVTARFALTLAAAGGVFAACWVLLDLLGPGRTLAFDLPAGMLKDVREPVRATRDLGVPFLEVTAGKVRPKAVPADVERPLPKDLDTPLAFFDPAAMPVVPVDPVPLVPALAKTKLEPEQLLELIVRAPELPVGKAPAEPRPVAVSPAEPKVEQPEPAAPVEAAAPIEAAAPVEAAPAPEPAERWEVVALPTPPVTRAPERTERPNEATIQALLARLERGMAPKPDAAPAAPPIPAEPAAPWPSLNDTLGELRALAAGRA